MGFAMSSSHQREWLVLDPLLMAIVAPILYAVRTRTSVAMGITVSVTAGPSDVVHAYTWGWVDYWAWSDFVLVPVRAFEPAFVHTLATAGFLHSQGDMMHVLGNVIILALVGVPCSSSGWAASDFAIVYVIGLLGSSLGWVAFNADSPRQALGASGAAFGLLGAYLAGWPKDEIPFPLLLIAPGPSCSLPCSYFGLELVRALSTMESVSPAASPTWRTSAASSRLMPFCLVARGGPVEPWRSTVVRVRAAVRPNVVASRPAWSTCQRRDDPWTAPGLRFYETPARTSQEPDSSQ